MNGTSSPASPGLTTPPRTAVRDVMRPGVIHVGPLATLAEIAGRIASERIPCVVVGMPDADAQCGVIPDAALARAAMAAPARALAATVAPTLAADEDVTVAARLMAELGVGALLVTEGGRAVGFITARDVA